MPENLHSEAPSMTGLVTGIVGDAERLVRQEIALARRELQTELEKARFAAVFLACGMGCTVLGSIFLGLMVVFLLNAAGLQLWACFLIVGGTLGIAGATLLYFGARQIMQISIVPPQTAETLQENVEWLQNRT